jgi:hypothetical protein
MVIRRIRIGFAVLQTSLYNPLRTAEQISVVDDPSALDAADLKHFNIAWNILTALARKRLITPSAKRVHGDRETKTSVGLMPRTRRPFRCLNASFPETVFATTDIANGLDLSDMSGRLIVGRWRGSLVNPHEYRGYQINPDSAQERFEEIEQTLLRCWTGEKVVHSGKCWNFGILMLRRPYSRPAWQRPTGPQAQRSRCAGPARSGMWRHRRWRACSHAPLP